VLLAHPVRWEVAPAVRADPPGLVISANAPQRKHFIALIGHDERPFRLTRVEIDLAGVEVEADLDASKPTHRLDVTIQPGPDNTGKPGQLTIATDHPEQSTVEVSVFISGGLANTEGTEASP